MGSLCEVLPWNPHAFLVTMSGRTLLLIGDSLTVHFCIGLQISIADYRLNHTEVDPFDRKFLFGCKVYKYDVIVCCGWIAAHAGFNDNVFGHPDGVLLGNLRPADVVLWNAGVHFSLKEASIQPRGSNPKLLFFHLA